MRIIVSFVVARILVFIKARSPSSISVVGVGVCVGAGVFAVILWYTSMYASEFASTSSAHKFSTVWSLNSIQLPFTRVRE